MNAEVRKGHWDNAVFCSPALCRPGHITADSAAMPGFMGEQEVSFEDAESLEVIQAISWIFYLMMHLTWATQWWCCLGRWLTEAGRNPHFQN